MSTNRTAPEQYQRVLHGPLEYTLFLDGIEDSSNVSRMARWPGCPDLQTYREAFIARMATLDQVASVLADNANSIYEGSDDFRVGLMQEKSGHNAAAELQLMFRMSREQIAREEICHDLHQTAKYSRWALQTWNQYRGQSDGRKSSSCSPSRASPPPPWAHGLSQTRRSGSQRCRPSSSPDWHGISTGWGSTKPCPTSETAPASYSSLPRTGRTRPTSSP